MEHVCTFLLLITLSTLCRAELFGTWYSANVINDGASYSPKPISEIFTSERPFSETQPIVVLPPSSTQIAPLSTSEIPTSFSTTQAPSSWNPSSPSTPNPTQEYSIPVSISTKSGYSSTEAPSSWNPPSPSTPYPTQEYSNPTSFSTQSSYSSTEAPSSWNPSSPSTPNPTQEYSNPTSFSTQSSYQPPSSTFETPSTRDPSTLSNSIPIFDFRQPIFFPNPIDKQISNVPNYFVIYQNAPQAQSPFSSPQPSVSSSSPSSFAPSTTFQPDLTAPQSTWSTLETNPPTASTTTSTLAPSTASTTFSTFQPSSFSNFPSQNPSSFSPTSPTPSETTTVATKSPRPSTIPCNNTNVRSAQPPRFPTLKIRMVAPSGSITNINVNPVITTTTKRPQTTRTRRTTTTKTPRTRRTKKTKNNYDSCISGCGEKRPICASPLAVTPVDPDKLKGFPTVCHMACHNSFRKEQYQMVVEGRCGRLRTKIHTFDSSSKIKKVELNKAQYTIVSNDPQVVILSEDFQ